jgi:dethiobiotin synthetase
MKNKGFFITGTDTGVGKTYIGAQIAELLFKMHLPVTPRKPIESGCEYVDEILQPDDAIQYFNAVEQIVSLGDICPFRFKPAISPQRAARLVNQPISVEETKHACLKNTNENDFLIIEGAGGFYSPLCEDGLNADLAQALQLPILLIANDQLGCINHILLTTEAIQNRNLEICAVVLNRKDHTHDDAMNNQEDLENLLDVPIFLVSQNEKLDQESELIIHISKH